MDEDLSSVIDSLASAGVSAYAVSQQPAQPVKTATAGTLAGLTGSGGSSIFLLLIIVIVGWFAYKAIK
jgi:hypothetical protein